MISLILGGHGKSDSLLGIGKLLLESLGKQKF
jgi:hypothetical protein